MLTIAIFYTLNARVSLPHINSIWAPNELARWETSTSPAIELTKFDLNTWRRHQMETFSALLAICAGNSPVPGEFPEQRPVTWNFDVFLDLRLNKWLSKQSWGWWFEMLSHSLWLHCNVFENFFSLYSVSITLVNISHWWWSDIYHVICQLPLSINCHSDALYWLD